MFAVLSNARKMAYRIAMIFALVWLAACQPVSLAESGDTGVSRASVPVALLVPLSASSAQEQKLARDLQNAARLAVSDLQGVKIDLRVYDTAGNTEQAQTAALKAVADGAEIIVGPLRAEAANAAAVAVAGKNINVLAFSNNEAVAGGNLFILGQTFRDTAGRLADYSVRNGKNRFLTVYSNNLAGRVGRQAIEDAVNSNGGVNVGSVSHEFSQNGVIQAIQEVKSLASTNNADVIFLTANAAGALPLVSQLLPESGLTKEQYQYVGLARWDTPPQTLELPGVQGGWFAMPDPNRTASYNNRFRAAYGELPHQLSGLAYDGIAAIGALARTGERGALSRSSLIQSAGYQGVTGAFRLLPDGTNERGMAVATIQERQIVILDPAPRSFSGTGF